MVEVDVDTKAYGEGHVAGALAWAWNTQLCDAVRRAILSKEQFEELMSSSGAGADTMSDAILCLSGPFIGNSRRHK